MIYVQDCEYNWYFIPEEQEEMFYKSLDGSVSKNNFRTFDKKYARYLIEDEPYDHRTGQKTAEREKILEEIESTLSESDTFIFRFNGANIEIPTQNVTTELLLYLSMIEMYGWKYYQNMKVNYNLPLPAQLESIVNMELMRKETE
jgi:hypothetical protein